MENYSGFLLLTVCHIEISRNAHILKCPSFEGSGHFGKILDYSSGSSTSSRIV